MNKILSALFRCGWSKVVGNSRVIAMMIKSYIEYGLRDGWFVATLYAPRLLSAMRPCLYPSVETVESILQRAPPELTTAGRTETKPWWEEDRPEPSPIAPAPKPKPADQDNVSRPPSTAVLLSEQSSEQTNLTVETTKSPGRHRSNKIRVRKIASKKRENANARIRRKISGGHRTN